MSLFVRDATGKLIRVNPGLPVARGNQGGMGRRLDEAELLSRLPDADLAGAVGVGVVPGGEQISGARRAKIEATEAASPPAATYRPLAGEQQNNRGNTITLTPNDTGFQSVCETSKSTGDDAELITVVLGLAPEWRDFPTNPAPLKTPKVACIIEWAIGNANFSANVDWIQGTVISVMASFVRVKAAYVPWTGFGTLPNVIISAGFAYGAKGASRAPARFTVDVPLIAALASSNPIPVPPFANSFTVVGVNNGGAQPNVRIAVAGSGGTASPRFHYTSDVNTAGQAEGQFPLQGDAASITLSNLEAVEAFKGHVIFTLGL